MDRYGSYAIEFSGSTRQEVRTKVAEFIGKPEVLPCSIKYSVRYAKHPGEAKLWKGYVFYNKSSGTIYEHATQSPADGNGR